MKRDEEQKGPTLPVLAAEFFTLFLVLPSVYAADLLRIPKLPVITGVALYCLLTLRHNGGIHLGREMNFSGFRRVATAILVRSTLVGTGAFALTYFFFPDWLFGFPRQRPFLWLGVMALYPLLSALPQEFIYRTFILRRYGPLFGDRTMLASVLTFGFLHIIYLNILAVALSTIAGWIFVRNYAKNRSLAAVATEHALYGCIVFTIGLGRFFYSGPSS